MALHYKSLRSITLSWARTSEINRCPYESPHIHTHLALVNNDGYHWLACTSSTWMTWGAIKMKRTQSKYKTNRKGTCLRLENSAIERFKGGKHYWGLAQFWPRFPRFNNDIFCKINLWVGACWDWILLRKNVSGRTDSTHQILNMFNIYEPISCSLGEPQGRPSTQWTDCYLGKTIANWEPRWPITMT